MISYVFLVMHMKGRPFRDKCVNRAHMQSLFSLVFVLISCLMLKAYQCADWATAADQAWARTMFQISLLVSNTYTYVVFLLMTRHIILKIRKENADSV